MQLLPTIITGYLPQPRDFCENSLSNQISLQINANLPWCSSCFFNISFPQSVYHQHIGGVKCLHLHSQTRTPQKDLIEYFSTIIKLNSSTTIRKRKSDRGSPCFKPLPTPNSYVWLSLTKTEILVVRMHSEIEPLHLLLNPISPSRNQNICNPLNHTPFRSLL